MKKFLRYLIIILIVFLALVIGIMFLSPKTMNFEVSEEIEAPTYMVFNLVNDLRNWEQWSPVRDLDENATHKYTDRTKGTGARWSWDGNEDIGKGSRRIINTVEGESIRTEIEHEGWDNLSHDQWTFQAENGGTKVTWAFEGGATPFIFRPFNFLMKGGYKEAYKTGLENLKKIAETRATERIYRGHKITDGMVGEKHFVINRQEVKLENIQQFYSQNLGSLFMKAQNAGLTMDGMPSGLFFSPVEREDVIDMAAAIPVKEDQNISGAKTLRIPQKRAVQVDYYGDYSGIAIAHEAIEQYLEDYNLFIEYPIIEEYVTDPGEEEDPSKWLTRVTYYVSENGS